MEMLVDLSVIINATIAMSFKTLHNCVLFFAEGDIPISIQLFLLSIIMCILQHLFGFYNQTGHMVRAKEPMLFHPWCYYSVWHEFIAVKIFKSIWWTSALSILIYHIYAQGILIIAWWLWGHWQSSHWENIFRMEVNHFDDLPDHTGQWDSPYPLRLLR